MIPIQYHWWFTLMWTKLWLMFYTPKLKELWWIANCYGSFFFMHSLNYGLFEKNLNFEEDVTVVIALLFFMDAESCDG